MKNIAVFVVSFFVAVLSTSCVVPVQRTGYYQQGGQQQVVKTTTLRAYVRLGADAPQDVVQRAEQATANQVGFEYAQSFEAGGKPKWPSLTRVTQIARKKLAANGHSLTPGQPGQPGCFKVMEYKPGVP